MRYSYIQKILTQLRPENLQDAKQRTLAIPVFMLMAVPMAFAITGVAITMGRPIFISQPRIGLKGKIFKIYKIRTMTNQRDADGALLPDDQRRTLFGSFLRATTLDETPQIWNVLRGDMVAIGPRPMEDPRPIPEWQEMRQQVKPGLTGLVQINDRPDVKMPDDIARTLETLYIDTAQRGGLKLWRLNAYILVQTAYVMVTANHAEIKIPPWLERRKNPRGPSGSPPP